MLPRASPQNLEQASSVGGASSCVAGSAVIRRVRTHAAGQYRALVVIAREVATMAATSDTRIWSLAVSAPAVREPVSARGLSPVSPIQARCIDRELGGQAGDSPRADRPRDRMPWSMQRTISAPWPSSYPCQSAQERWRCARAGRSVEHDWRSGRTGPAIQMTRRLVQVAATWSRLAARLALSRFRSAMGAGFAPGTTLCQASQAGRSRLRAQSPGYASPDAACPDARRRWRGRSSHQEDRVDEVHAARSGVDGRRPLVLVCRTRSRRRR